MNIDIGGQKHRNDINGKWKILDVSKSADYVCNLNEENLPFKDNTIDSIYCSHTLEHIELAALPDVLKEIYRVLKLKTGVLRIVVPDCEKAIKWYLEKPEILKDRKLPRIFKNVPKTKMGYLSCWFSTPGRGHKIGFDYELLLEYLKNAGFKKIIRKKFNECSKIFIEKDIKRYESFSIYLETIK